jgi:hypothetical protein
MVALMKTASFGDRTDSRSCVMVLIVAVRLEEVLPKARSQCLRPRSRARVIHGVDISYLRVVFDTERVDNVRKHPKSVSDF